MTARIFSPILIILVIALVIKLSLLFSRINEQTSLSHEASSSSVLISDAYASNSEDTGHKEKDAKAQDAKPEEEKPRVNVNLNDMPNLTKSEVDLLKELAKRRDKIEHDKKSITVREQVLKATESKIDKKMADMKSLQLNIEKLMKEYDIKEQGKISSLVKIYETMKPKDAAKIFNELEMPILLKVVSNMKEVKVAPIIAAMTPTKARDISVELAKQKGIQ